MSQAKGYAPPGDLARVQRGALLVGGAALALSILGGLADPGQFFRSYLVAFVYWLSIALGCSTRLPARPRCLLIAAVPNAMADDSDPPLSASAAFTHGLLGVTRKENYEGAEVASGEAPW